MLAWNQVALLIAPPLLLATTHPVYQLLERRYGKKWSYLGGFLFYWTLWCLLFPLALLGPQRLLGLFRGVSSPFGHPWWLGAFCLLAPPLVAFIFLFPGVLQKASVRLVLVSALLALVNGPLEEVLWRGAYLTLFPGQSWLTLLYPSLGFARLPPGSHVGRCANRRGSMEQGRTGGAGVLSRALVGLGREHHGEHSLDGRRAHPDRLLCARMECPFHHNLFERRSVDCLRRCHGRGDGLTPRAWCHCPFAFMSLGLLVRVTRLSLLAILVAAEPDHQDDMSLPWLRHSLESLTDRRATG